MKPLEAWLTRQYGHSAQAMLRSVSATSLLKVRAGFGQRIIPKKGSVIASPVPGAYDPDPDYFFHWFRDSALVMDALRHLCRAPGGLARGGPPLTDHFADFIRFSLELEKLDGRALTVMPAWRARIEPGHLQFLRSDAELSAVRAELVAADTRVNPDASLDLSRWPRPQFDGPALRALCTLRWLRDVPLDTPTQEAAQALLRHDLDFTLHHWAEPCFDIWEEELGFHYYTLRVTAAALRAGSQWLEQRGEPSAAGLEQAAKSIMARLDTYWDPPAGYLRSRVLSDGQRSSKELDISVMLSAIHADDGASKDLAHDAGDPRMLATLAQLEALFDADYAINRGRPATVGTAMGRYRGDAYFSGGAYYFSTLGAAELCFRAAAKTKNPAALIARGDGFLETVRRFTPPDGELSEQFDQNTGAPNSAPQLAWSYAALISAVAARDAVIPRSAETMAGSGTAADFVALVRHGVDK